MPLSLNPEDTTPYVLVTDRRIEPPEKRPAFLLKFLTGIESAKVEKLFDQIGDAKDPDAENALLDEAIAVGLRSTKNLPEKFDAKAGLTKEEKYELAGAVLREPTLAERERKSFVLEQLSGAASSANTAPAGSAEASPPAPAI